MDAAPGDAFTLGLCGTDTTSVRWLIENTAWSGLLLLGYILITCVLTVLCRHHRHELAVHDLVRQTQAKRRAYLASLSMRQDQD